MNDGHVTCLGRRPGDRMCPDAGSRRRRQRLASVSGDFKTRSHGSLLGARRQRHDAVQWRRSRRLSDACQGQFKVQGQSLSLNVVIFDIQAL